MRVTWTLADDLLAGLPSWTDRLPILERLVPIDLPVPGGSGAVQYRCALPVLHGLSCRKRLCCRSLQGFLDRCPVLHP